MRGKKRNGGMLEKFCMSYDTVIIDKRNRTRRRLTNSMVRLSLGEVGRGKRMGMKENELLL